MDEKKYIHHGHNIKRIRVAQKVKQAALAIEIGVSQQTIARMEGQQVLPDKKIKMVATALQVPEQVIKEMEEDPAHVTYANNTFTNEFKDNSVGNFGNIENLNFKDSTSEELILEQNKRLEENTTLLQEMLKQNSEYIKLIQQVLKKN